MPGCDFKVNHGVNYFEGLGTMLRGHWSGYFLQE